MLIVPDYRCYRIEVNTVAEGTCWNADVTIRRDRRPARLEAREPELLGRRSNGAIYESRAT